MDSDAASNSVDGKIAVIIPVPLDANCLRIQVLVIILPATLFRIALKQQ